jgi:glycosyltransferase involved in cell wall biosynthesis
MLARIPIRFFEVTIVPRLWACTSAALRLLRFAPVARPVPIAFVLSSFEPGGTERQMVELVQRLDRSRWAAHVVSMRAGGELRDRVADVAPIAAFPVTSFHQPEFLHQVWSLAAWCRRNRIAVVHTVDLPANVFGLAASSLARVPVRIANRRNVNPGKTMVELGAQRLAYAGAHRIVANCHAAADRLRFERVPRKKIAVIPNGIDLARFARPAISTAVRRVVIVGNLRPEKGHDVLIDAAALVAQRFPATRFDIVGAGPLRDALTRRVHERQLASVVRFAGHQADVATWLQAADLLVLPSRSEAFPNAVLEGMAAGLAIVASDVGGVPELIDDGRTGLLTPAGDARVLADRISSLIADPAMAARLGAAARREVASRYSFERMVTQFENLYATELARRGLLALTQPLPAAF